jgi:hypothetical protein
MTPTGLGYYAEMFRLAVEAQNYSLAQTALQKYVTCFRSRSRTLVEIEDARSLLQWGVQVAKAQKAQMAEDLMRLKRVFDAYGPLKRKHTWRLEG